MSISVARRTLGESNNGVMNQVPLTSVVIPCYNGERFVGEAIQSALIQTYPNVEVIVIDDGSTDNSLGVIRSYGNHVRWETGPNRGGCAARNRGVALARGELIQFLDADDLLHPKKLEQQVSAKRAAMQNIVYCDREEYGLGTTVERRYCRVSPLDDPILFSLQKIPLTSAPLHSRAELERVGGFRIDLPCAQDYDLLFRLAMHARGVTHIDRALFMRRLVPGSVSSDSVQVIKQTAEIRWDMFWVLKSRCQLTETRAKAFAASMAGAARALLRHGEVSEADRFFEDAMRMHPSGVDRAYGRAAGLFRRMFGVRLTEQVCMFLRSALGWREPITTERSD